LGNFTEVDEGGAKDFDVDIEFSRVVDYAWYGLVYNYLLELMATSPSAPRLTKVNASTFTASPKPCWGLSFFHAAWLQAVCTKVCGRCVQEVGGRYAT